MVGHDNDRHLSVGSDTCGEWSPCGIGLKAVLQPKRQQKGKWECVSFYSAVHWLDPGGCRLQEATLWKGKTPLMKE